MNQRVGLLVLAVSVLCSACETIPRASVVYAHKRVLGVEVGGGADAAKPGVYLKIGYTEDLGTYLPVALQGDKIVPIGSRLSALVEASKSLGKGEGSAPISLNFALPVLSDGQESSDVSDTMSLYSSFSTQTIGSASQVQGTVGNVFATGLAARYVAQAHRTLACRDLQASLEKAEADKKEAIEKIRDALCK